MDQDSAHMVAASKVPMLKPGEFELWRMRIEQYIQMIDYALWEVIENGATLPKTQVVEGVTTVMPITSAEDKAQRRLEVKARSTLMMGIPNEHQLKFNSIKDAKLLLEAVEKRFGGNAATKKTQRNLLKQQYENFTAPSSEMLDQTFDRLQKLVSQLELLDEKLSQEDVNQNLLRSLSPEWNTHAVVWRNKAELETMSMYDIYNNLKVYELQVKGMSSSCSSTQNMAFVSSSNNNTSSSNEAVNAAHRVTTASTQVNTTYSTNIDNMRRKLTVNGNDTIGFDKSKVECYNCHMRGHFARECRPPRNQDNKNKKSSRRSVLVETSTSIALVSCDGLGGYDWSDQVEEGPNYALMAYSSPSSDSEIVDNCKKGLGYEKYNAVPSPYIENFMPPTLELSFTSLDKFVNELVVKNSKAMSSEEESKVVRKNDDALIIEEWVSYSEEENVSQTKIEKKIVKPSFAKIEFVKPKQQEKTARKTVKQVEKHRQNTHSLRGNQRNWNNMMSQKLGSNFEMMVKPVWNNAQRVNHQYFAKKTHPCAKKNRVPRAVLMKSGLVLNNTARQVNATHSKTTVNAARPMSYLSKIAHSTVKRPIHENTTFKNSNINQRVNTTRDKKFNTARPKAVVNAVKGNNFNAVKASTCWVWKPKTKVLDHVSKHNSASITLKKFDYGNPQMDLQDQGVIDSGCSRHMTGNMSYLTDYEEIDGGYVAFGRNPKGGKITRKGKAKKSVRLMMEKLFGMELELILFWSTVKAKTINGEVQLHALVDGKKIIVTELTVRRDLQLKDAEGSTIPTDPHHTPTIIESSSQPQKTQKPRKPKIKDTQIPQPSGPIDIVADEAVHKELGDSLVRVATTASSLEVEQDSGNITKTRSKATPNESSSLGTTSGGGPRCQETMRDIIAQTRFKNVSKLSNNSLLARGNTLRSDEDSLKLKELMKLCTNLQTRRRINAIDADEDITLVSVQDDADAEMFDVDTLTGDEVFVAEQEVANEKDDDGEISLAQALIEIKSIKPKVKGIIFQEPGKSTTTTTTISSQQSQEKVHDKGKGKMVEPEPVKATKKKVQIMLDEEIALKLQAEIDEEERITRAEEEKIDEANIS
ncbi:ribonuclease H-like domain-containing protein [Tanacetum coccineum]